LGRGEKLTAGPETIYSGQIWSGIDAKRLGIADELGTETDAYNKAAQLAKVANYQTEDLAALAGVNTSGFLFFIQSPDGMSLPYPNKAGVFMLYIPPLPVK